MTSPLRISKQVGEANLTWSGGKRSSGKWSSVVTISEASLAQKTRALPAGLPSGGPDGGLRLDPVRPDDAGPGGLHLRSLHADGQRECNSNQVDAEAMLRFTLKTLKQMVDRNGNREKLRQKLMERARRGLRASS